MGEFFTGKSQVLLLKPHVNAAICESKDHLSQIVQVTGQPIHRVADHRVALTHVAGKLFQLRPVEILAGCFVHETLVEMDTFELTQLFLIERADAQIADGLSGSAFPFCSFRF